MTNSSEGELLRDVIKKIKCYIPGMEECENVADRHFSHCFFSVLVP
jgi:hypothetical protein